MARWDEKPLEELRLDRFDADTSGRTLLDAFLETASYLNRPGRRSISTSLVYRLEQLLPGLEAILNNDPRDLVPFMAKQLSRSEGNRDDPREESVLLGHASRISALVARKNGDGSLKPDIDPLLVARFMGGRISRANEGERS